MNNNLFGTVLEDDVDVLLILETMVEADDVRVDQITMQLDFACYLNKQTNKQTNKQSQK